MRASKRYEINAIAPGRSRASDGTIGDPDHADRESDHNPDETGNVPIRDADRVNEVHALDIDKDLNTPGLTMEQVVQHLLALARAGDQRLRYVIYRRRIWSASNGWRQQPYDRANPHEEHAHFSASYATVQERRTDTYHLEELNPMLSDPDKTWLTREITRVVQAELTRFATGDGDTTGRIYSRDGLATTTEQDTKEIRRQLTAVAEKLDALTPPA